MIWLSLGDWCHLAQLHQVENCAFTPFCTGETTVYV